MQLITKFLGSSLLVGGLILALSGGGNWLLKRAEQQVEVSYQHQRQALDTALALEVSLQHEVQLLKDYLLLDRKRANFIQYEQAKSDVLIRLDKLELLLTDNEDVELLRRRHRDIVRLANKLTEGETSLSNMRQDLYALNSFVRDIEFYANLLLDQTRQQELAANNHLRKIRATARTANTIEMVLILLLLAAQFSWILLPVLRSIQQLKLGVTKVGEGELNYRLAITTGDEIEALGHEFNQMTTKLQVSNQQLNHQMQAVQVAQQAAETANRAKSSFLANMNHELRTPLNGILGYAQILGRDATLSTKQLKGVEVIQQCATHLLTLINDVLDISKIEAGKVDLHPKDVHLSNFLMVTTEICRIKADQKGIKFVYAPANGLPLVVHVDDKRLRQVLLNLLSNAIKFTDIGTVTLSIEPVDEAQTQQFSGPVQLRFTVKDTGIGIPADKLTHIFTPFEQAVSDEHNSQGTGLGLAISQEIVKMMGGEIQVVSTLGQGSRFWFELELETAQEGQATESRDRITRQITGYQGNRQTVLAIDDESENRDVLVDMLEPLGFQVVTADTGKSGLLAAQLHKPDLIITDVMMPEMDGLEMTRQLRQQDDFATTPIIASPATFSRVDKRESLTAGCTAFLPKPIDFSSLLQEIQCLLELEWIYSNTVAESAAATEQATSEWIVPPAPELVKLYQLAKAGFIGDVQKEAKRLKQLDQNYTLFVNKLLELAQAFEDDAIIDLVEQYV